MNQKLVLLNLVLAVAVVFAGVKWRDQYRAEKAREAELHNAKIKPKPAPPFYPLPNDPPVMSTGYKEVAIKTLFHPSRDPNEPVELPPPPPPPPPMPDLPRYHGQMNLGDGPMALLVERPGMAEKALKPGEAIGQFKLVDVNTSEITFQWTFNGATVRRTLGQLIDHTAVAAVAAAAEARPLNNAQPAAPVVVAVKSVLGPGESTPFGKTCLPDDSSPEGAVSGGYRKKIIQTPFGKSCIWDPVGREERFNMKLFFAIMLSAAALLATDPQEKKGTAPPKAADGSKPMAIPPGSIKAADGDFHYTDPQGKKWIYRITPFGVVRLEENTDAQAKVLDVDKAAGIKATEDGDMVRFERLGPFGMWKWEKKKSELDETEKAALEKSRSETTTSKQR